MPRRLSGVFQFRRLAICRKPREAFRQKLAVMRAKPLPFSRQRFLRRARAEGVIFSREVETSTRSSPWYFRPRRRAGPGCGTGCLGGQFFDLPFPREPDTAGGKDDSAAQQIAELKRQNCRTYREPIPVKQFNRGGEREIQESARTTRDAATTADKAAQPNKHGEAEKSSSQTAQLLDESRNQEKLLAEARDEAAAYQSVADQRRSIAGRAAGSHYRAYE